MLQTYTIVHIHQKAPHGNIKIKITIYDADSINGTTYFT